MKTLTMMIALLTVTSAAMAESNYVPRQTQAALAEAQAAQKSSAPAVNAPQAAGASEHSNYTRR
ncbi:hypothetical protein [Paludibacterium purpuratum]|uniref:DUF4148 domain-containing protein n=1 Tax=Paludibacterium purpuratum TaxID=1144873 RepID=A0A4R7BCS8_9NEIS|nr:hypothetical protein [Paludibacterium purpuratum]TDR82758.1 hypothetical protein DFP86_101147 [Paludibacterium purpuratum]